MSEIKVYGYGNISVKTTFMNSPDRLLSIIKDERMTKQLRP
jgi:hypothetical protein